MLHSLDTANLTFIKFGGSLITDKREEGSFHKETMRRLSSEIALALQEDDSQRLLLGHGSGSFGHMAASRHDTVNGVRTVDEWRGFAEVATVAAELNYLVASILSETGVAVWRLQPSASACCEDGKLVKMEAETIRIALDHSLVPLVYGDVALDTVRGGTIISTEQILGFLARKLPVKRILLLGEVAGVLDARGELIPEITPNNIAAYRSLLRGSAGTDVTGGMLTKVEEMLDLATAVAGLTIRIADGRKHGLLYDTLTAKAHPGTLIHAP